MPMMLAQRAIEPHASTPVELEELQRRIEDEDTSFVLLSVLPRAAFEAGQIPGLRARIEGVAMIFAGEMQAVRDVVHGRPPEGTGADDAALEGLVSCLAAGLQELSDLLTCLPAGQRAPAPSGGACGASRGSVPSSAAPAPPVR